RIKSNAFRLNLVYRIAIANLRNNLFINKYIPTFFELFPILLSLCVLCAFADKHKDGLCVHFPIHNWHSSSEFFLSTSLQL
ncbi:MAG: hypothetical protein MR712_04785, partial [Bacteroidales bacterium]|nr:hypothetical protein [Bacteroidales bacterium]